MNKNPKRIEFCSTIVGENQLVVVTFAQIFEPPTPKKGVN